MKTCINLRHISQVSFRFNVNEVRWEIQLHAASEESITLLFNTEAEANDEFERITKFEGFLTLYKRDYGVKYISSRIERLETLRDLTKSY